MRIRTKLWLFILISAVASLFLFIFLSITMGKILNKGYDLNQLGGIAFSTLSTINEQTTFDLEHIKPVLDNVHQAHPNFRFEFIRASGMPVYDTSGVMKEYQFQELAERFLNMPANLWNDGREISLIITTERDEQSYYLLMSLPSELMKSGQLYIFFRTWKAVFSLAIPLLVSILIPYFLSLWFFSSTNKRIRKLNEALNQVSIQSDGLEIKDTSQDELGQLTRHYNDMTRRIRTQVEQIEQFENKRRILLSNLSHDLRTPLTMMLGYAETIRAGHYKDEKELQAGAKIILQRSRYMDRLLDQILDISRLNEADLKIQLTNTNLSELMRKIAADYFMILDGEEFIFEVDISDDDLYADMDAALIERLIRNLLDNAIRYGKDGQYFQIGLFEEDHNVCITVKDKGVGVALEDQDRIFERFYRVDSGRKGEGLGIGLSIVKDITEAHQGDIQLTSIPNVETVFHIRLPKTG